MASNTEAGFIGHSPTLANLSGVWTLNEVTRRNRAGSWPGQASLSVSPPYTTGYSNHSYSSSPSMGYWNSGKGLIITSPSIYSTGNAYWNTNSQGGYTEGASSVTVFSSIPSTLWWVYAVVIGGGGGGDGNGQGDGGGGGGFAFAKLDLRSYAGQTLVATAGSGGAQYGQGSSSSLAIGGTTVISASGGNNWGSGGSGGTGSVASHASVVRSTVTAGGSGANNNVGGTGATGGGSGSGSSSYVGGNATQPFCGAGSGGDGPVSAGGTNTANYNNSPWTSDPETGLSVLTQAKAYSAISGYTFFSGASATTWNNGMYGRSTTSPSNTSAGFFGSGGGGSGSGSGFYGGPGAVILWWG